MDDEIKYLKVNLIYFFSKMDHLIIANNFSKSVSKFTVNSLHDLTAANP